LKCVKMFNDEEDESFESSTDSGSDSEPEFKGTAKPDSDDEGPQSPDPQPPSNFFPCLQLAGDCGSWLIADDVQSVITRRSTATSVLTDKTSATGKSKAKKKVRILLPLPYPRRPVHAIAYLVADVV
jgi:hypothetical protein